MGAIQIGDVIRLSELAWKVWEYGWGSEHNAGENYRAFGADVSTLHTNLRRLEEAVTRAQTSFRDKGALDTDKLGGDKTSLSEIIGDYEKTLNDCNKLLENNRRYGQITGPAKNINWSIHIMPQVDHLRGRIKMHNLRIGNVIMPFQIDLFTNIHKDLTRRLTSMHKDLLATKESLNMLLAMHYPDVARAIEQQSMQEHSTVKIPDSIQRRLEDRLDPSLTLQGLTDCFLVHLERITAESSEKFRRSPPIAEYVELLKCQFIMNRIKNLDELENPPRLSHWPRYIEVLEEKLSIQCSQFGTAPDISEWGDEMLTFWSEDERNRKKPQQTAGPPLYDRLLEVSLAPESDDPAVWRMMRLLRKNRSEQHFRIVDFWGYNDLPPTEEPKVVDFNINTATLVPIYADPVEKGGTFPPLEIYLEEDDICYRYVFLDIKDILLFQRAITGFKVADNYTEPHATATFVRPGQDKLPIEENVTVQVWIPLKTKGSPEKEVGAGYRRPSSCSQTLAASNFDNPSRNNSIASSPSTAASSTSGISSSSDNTIPLRVSGPSINTGYVLTRPCPIKPLLVLFTRDATESPKRSIVAIEIDDEAIPKPKYCGCHKSKFCPVMALEHSQGRFRAKRLEDAKWNLLSLLKAPDWAGLLRINIQFPTAEERFKFSGESCKCKIVIENHVDKCLLSGHLGLLGATRHLYRRQMVRWQKERER